MPETIKLPPAPSADKRWKIVDSTIRRHGYQKHALFEVLHTVQECFGFLDEQALRYVSAALRVPPAKVYGVATFYHFFQMKPAGKHTCVVCMGTACYIKGAPNLLQVIDENYGVKAGETSPDGELSVLTARCIGSCGLAPAAVFDGEVAGKLDKSDTLTRLTKSMQQPTVEKS